MSYIVKGRGGYFFTYVVNCAGEPLTVQVLLEQYNIDGEGRASYVDAGEACLPVVEGVFCAAHAETPALYCRSCSAVYHADSREWRQSARRNSRPRWRTALMRPIRQL